jgi:hypothetical protein
LPDREMIYLLVLFLLMELFPVVLLNGKREILLKKFPPGILIPVSSVENV